MMGIIEHSMPVFFSSMKTAVECSVAQTIKLSFLERGESLKFKIINT